MFDKTMIEKSSAHNNTMRSFTFLEIIVVSAILVVLVGVLIAVLKPTEIFKKTRDSKRITDLQNLDILFKTIETASSTFFSSLSTTTVYISLPDNSATCSSYISQLPTLPSDWSYRCSATPTDPYGNGWIPLDFSKAPFVNISQLPIDPINQPPYYYSFVVGRSYVLYAQLENLNRNAPSFNDGDNFPHLYSVGTDKNLLNKAQGLVGYWPFDEGTGTIAYDYSGNNNNGTLVNGPQWVAGKIGYSLGFDGTNKYVHTATFTNFPSSFLSTCAWIKTNVTSAYIWQINRSPSNYYYEGIFRIYNGKVQFWDYSTTYGFSASSQTSNRSVNDNNWHFVCFVKANTTGKYYIDGNFDNQVTASVNVQYGSNNFVIGKDYRDNASYFNGLIDEVRIYNRALSAEEIKALYEATK